MGLYVNHNRNFRCCAWHVERKQLGTIIFSAGNEPAMRSAIIGVCYGHDEAKLQTLVKRATIITHSDPKAYYGALAVALAAHMATTSDSIDGLKFQNYLDKLLSGQDAGEFLQLIQDAVGSAKQASHTRDFAISLGLNKGITGYIYHTVPTVIHAWLVNPNNFQKALSDIISCGGDTDTTGAILGAIVGASVGKHGIPAEWIEGLVEWPRTVAWMESLARQTAQNDAKTSESDVPRLPVLGVAIQNTLFTLIVLLHGFRRLLPPY